MTFMVYLDTLRELKKEGGVLFDPYILFYHLHFEFIYTASSTLTFYLNLNHFSFSELSVEPEFELGRTELKYFFVGFKFKVILITY